MLIFQQFLERKVSGVSGADVRLTVATECKLEVSQSHSRTLVT